MSAGHDDKDFDHCQCFIAIFKLNSLLLRVQFQKPFLEMLMVGFINWLRKRSDVPVRAAVLFI